MRLFRHRQRQAMRATYFTVAEHRQEAERLALVIDEVLQSDAERSLSDLIAIARLHLDLANASEPAAAPAISATA